MKWSGCDSSICKNFTVAVAVLVTILTWSQYGHTELSEYTECTEVEFDKSEFDRPLTQEEQIALWDDDFQEQLADITKCTDSQIDSARGGGASQGGAGASQGGGGASKNTESTSSDSLSRNALKGNQKSTSVTNTVVQIPQSNDEASPGVLDNGREETALVATDNKAALRAQIKAQIDVETDPEVKRLLIKQLEALK